MNEILFKTENGKEYTIYIDSHSLKQIMRSMAILVEDDAKNKPDVNTLYFFFPFVNFLHAFVKYCVAQKIVPCRFDKADPEWIIGALSSWQILCNKFVEKRGDDAPEFCKKRWADRDEFKTFSGLFADAEYYIS
ncbi:MAG: hypothetical protein V1688_01690 [bacterium]